MPHQDRPCGGSRSRRLAGTAPLPGRLGPWLRANTDWAIGNSRYPRADAALPTRYTDTPVVSRLEPLPLPCPAWWWDLL
ncbi:hypothetical protein [Streptomyces sp. BK208]|uniref:hypothetical protein n=1 Tax=Streptomyces sp. BK208 TaxID=2512150 RepID=UPI00105B3851|nr:hypothetical protein [Streptomyces sp. BK208]